MRTLSSVCCRKRSSRRAYEGGGDAPGVLCMVIVEASVYPSFAKEGWTRPKENAAKHPLWSGRGGCFKLRLIHSERVWIIGGLKQPPRLRRLRKGAIFFMAQPPLLREGGECACPKRFRNLDSSACTRKGALLTETSSRDYAPSRSGSTTAEKSFLPSPFATACSIS